MKALRLHQGRFDEALEYAAPLLEPVSRFAASIFDDGRGSIRLLAYEVVHVDGEPAPTVHQALAWVAPEDVTSFDLLPADVPIAQALADGDPSSPALPSRRIPNSNP